VNVPINKNGIERKIARLLLFFLFRQSLHYFNSKLRSSNPSSNSDSLLKEASVRKNAIRLLLTARQAANVVGRAL
jgi:hypothetical protein